jgi:hypothetical protein
VEDCRGEKVTEIPNSDVLFAQNADDDIAKCKILKKSGEAFVASCQELVQLLTE